MQMSEKKRVALVTGGARGIKALPLLKAGLFLLLAARPIRRSSMD
jgi:NAD(P)-dependent dehydrogenase (short-subunit alcohol dehydrogenase family)